MRSLNLYRTPSGYLKGSTQLEAFYERYQREGVPNDLSMQAFCSMHNVPYNCFERHVRQRAKFKNIKPVSITTQTFGIWILAS